MHGKISDKELYILKELFENGTITEEWLSGKAEKMKKKKEKEVLENHPYSVYEYQGYWYTTVPDKTKGRRKIKKKKKEDLERAILDYYMSEMEDQKMTIQEAFKRWNDARLAADYVKGSTYLRDQRYFEKYYDDWKDKKIEAISREMWTSYLQKILCGGVTAKQWGGVKNISRGIINFCEDSHLVTYTADDVIGHVRVYKNAFIIPAKDYEQEVYYSDELQALNDYCTKNSNPYTRCIRLSILIGSRIGECASLRVDDVDIDNMTITIRRTETRADENGKPAETIRDGAKTETGIRTVSVPKSAYNFLKEIVEIAKRYDGGWLFPQEPGRWKTRYVGNRIRSQQLRRRMKEICEEIGITYKPPHKIRKTYASILRENNVDEQTILDQMGHTTISTTEQHYFRSRRRAAERSKQLGEIGELAALTK